MINLKKSKAILATMISVLVFSSVVFASDEIKAPSKEPSKAIQAIYTPEILYKPLEDMVVIAEESKEEATNTVETKNEEVNEESEVYSYLEVTAFMLNIRETPDISKTPIGVYRKGDLVIAHAKTINGWYKLSSGHYINGKYAKVREDIKTYVQFVEERNKKKVKSIKAVKSITDTKKAVEEPVTTASVGQDVNTACAGTTKASINLTESERDYLARLIRCEAGGEPFDGQVAVAKVVVNRVLDGRFPDTITEVINAKNQFTPVSTGKINQVAATQTQYDAIDAALSSNDNLGGAVYFYAPRIVKSEWFESLQTVAVIGDHHFKIN